MLLIGPLKRKLHRTARLLLRHPVGLPHPYRSPAGHTELRRHQIPPLHPADFKLILLCT